MYKMLKKIFNKICNKISIFIVEKNINGILRSGYLTIEQSKKFIEHINTSEDIIEREQIFSALLSFKGNKTLVRRIYKYLDQEVPMNSKPIISNKLIRIKFRFKDKIAVDILLLHGCLLRDSYFEELDNLLEDSVFDELVDIISLLNIDIRSLIEIFDYDCVYVKKQNVVRYKNSVRKLDRTNFLTQLDDILFTIDKSSPDMIKSMVQDLINTYRLTPEKSAREVN